MSSQRPARDGSAPQSGLFQHWKFKSQPRPPSTGSSNATASLDPSAGPPRVKAPSRGDNIRPSQLQHHWKYDPKAMPAPPLTTAPIAPRPKPITSTTQQPAQIQFHHYNPSGGPPPTIRNRGQKMRSSSPLPVTNRSVSPYGRPYPHSVGHTPPQHSYLASSPPDSKFQMLLSSVEQQLRLEEEEEQRAIGGLLRLAGAAELMENEAEYNRDRYPNYKYSDSETESEPERGSSPHGPPGRQQAHRWPY